VYVKDLVDASEGFATMRLEFLPHWMLIGAVRAGESLDSAAGITTSATAPALRRCGRRPAS
jgi:hypothetical protein